MITYSNIVRYDGLPFDEYLKLPALSHSFLKREKMGITEDLKMTDNIRIGSLVDDIITQPSKADMYSPLYPYARNIAAVIRNRFGSLINQFQKQVSYTADASFGDFTMPVKGRLDFLIPNLAVIDLKVTMSKDLRGLIEFMGYKNQDWHYSKLSIVPNAYLMIYSIPLKKTEIVKVDCSSNDNPFWGDKITKFGKVLYKPNDEIRLVTH